MIYCRLISYIVMYGDDYTFDLYCCTNGLRLFCYTVCFLYVGVPRTHIYMTNTNLKCKDRKKLVCLQPVFSLRVTKTPSLNECLVIAKSGMAVWPSREEGETSFSSHACRPPCLVPFSFRLNSVSS